MAAKTIKIITAVATFATVLVCVGFAIFGVVISNWVLFASCLGLALMAGFMSYNDYSYFFGKKNDSASKGR